MKIIHLSDLHLGKRVNEFSMLEDQEYILKKIINIIDDEAPQAVIIAGDVYDKSTPSAEAVKLFDDFLYSLSSRDLKTFIISGNHDSAERIAFGSRIMDKGGIYLSPVYDGKISPITLADEHGSINFYMLPFIKPANVRRYITKCEGGQTPPPADRPKDPANPHKCEGGQTPPPADQPKDPANPITTYTDAMRAVIDDLNIDTTERNVFITHQFVTGASRTESEDISVGGTDNVDASVFDGIDYVALGHIHRSQKCGSEYIRYCGTPLKYSFSEAKDKKSVTVINMKEKGSIDLSFIQLIPKHDMVEIRGTYNELMLKDFYAGTTYGEDYMHITLTDEDDIPDVLSKMRTVYKNIMKLDYDNARTRHYAEVTGASDVNNKTPIEHFSEFYELRNGQPMSSEQAEFMTQIIEEIWRDE